MNGIIIVNKPSGLTSHDVVAEVRRHLKFKKVGHTGTLDPSATGVLPLMINKATKLSPYLMGADKTYTATIKLGITTNTYDGDGEIQDTKDVNVTEEDCLNALNEFRGHIQQIPPMFSAKKINGKRLYKLARKGIEVEREPKNVTISLLELIDFTSPLIKLKVSCSAGTYIRVIAQDLGHKLGCGAHLSALERTQVGSFYIEDAIDLKELIENPESAQNALVPLNQALNHIVTIEIPKYMSQLVKQGHQITAGELRQVDVPNFTENEIVALSEESGSIFALTRALLPSDLMESQRRTTKILKTEKVL